ncbi:MAG: chemotaxis protein CheA [Verrucomicrobia bacterium]|nr:chemotaxis protein CheA [Verrucomicrobiota bacterium]
MTPVKVPASELIRAFVGEYRQMAVDTRPILNGIVQSGGAPCHLSVDAYSLLNRLAHRLRDSGLFLGFPRLAAIARVLVDLLYVEDGAKTEAVLTPAQTQLLVKGYHLAEQIVESVETQQREPSMEAELAGFAQAARALGVTWEVAPFSRVSSGHRETPPSMSDAEKVEQLLAEGPAPVSVEPATSATGSLSPSPAGDMVNIFAQDAEEILDHAEQNLLGLEAEPARLNDLLRQFHTLKGNSGLMGYSQMQTISHRLEDVLHHARDQRSALGPDSVRLFLKAVDVLRRCVASLRKGGDPSVPDYAGWLQRVDAWAGSSPAETPPSPASVEEAVPSRPAPAEPPPVADAHKPAAQVGDGIRINVERLDQLNDLTSELIAASAVVMHLSERRPGVDGEQYERACHQLDLITSWLQNLSMSMRMVPVELAFRRLHRLVRDLSEKTGKSIKLQLVGAETEADRRVIELIVDPLVHLVRNAVDHGIESREERQQLAKPETGTIRIEAFQRSGEVWIVISDDGRGLQRAKILERARARGLVKRHSQLRDEQVVDLIFEPGFSTAETVTEVSGRGVGLDVVRKNLERLRGRVEVQSVEGVSTTMTLRIPLTLSVINGMMVRVGSEQFVLPVESIRELLQPGLVDEHRLVNNGTEVSVREETIPLFRLADLFTISGAVERADEGVVVVVEDAGCRAGLLVDETIGQQRVVVKSLRESLGRVTGISGASILADGRVRLIMDVPGLIRIARERAR